VASESDGSLWLIVPAWSLSDLAALLRQQLFVYRDPFVWIDQLPAATARSRG
jgi:type III secretory pathway component EscR